MINKFKPLGLSLSTLTLVLSAAVLSGCHSGDESLTVPSATGITPTVHARGSLYDTLRETAAIDDLFNLAAATPTGPDTTPLCPVKVHRIDYGTVGGAGEATNSTGVFMLPHDDDGTNAACAGPRPVVLYAHGTWDERTNDLSKFVVDSSNGASTEAAILLAFYASRGYAVIAPNYAGYADSALSYHPYVDEAQQSTEMVDALNHVRNQAGAMGANLSSQLFITGLSQGGYVAMATHKKLQAAGESVTASLPISGPYAMRSFLDGIMGGAVNGGATVFAPMYLTALEKAHDIYTNPNQVYSAAYATVAENSLPRPGGFTAAGLPGALFNDGNTTGPLAPPSPNPNPAGWDSDYLLSDALRGAYLADMGNPTTYLAPANQIRKLTTDLDLRNWSPTSRVVMCGAGTDPVVYHSHPAAAAAAPTNPVLKFGNSDNMMEYWTGAGVSSSLVENIDLDEAATGTIPHAAVARGAWASAAPSLAATHGLTGVYCSKVGLTVFDSML